MVVVSSFFGNQLEIGTSEFNYMEVMVRFIESYEAESYQ
ncbi:hypothetical protein O185_07540 [Photorhabdus temperata J3]|uniref:Uncharacterized protein n=1 Tax=Photorhabdus temperata J3 TaxID=1389415 RepID=U7R249_PHOTE|nr:hypothetical protein O185_07540 [Photorhabdus temperata J3]